MKHGQDLKDVDIDAGFDQVAQLPPAERRRGAVDHRALEYLKKGVGISVIMSPLVDQLDPHRKVIGSSTTLTDGIWAWTNFTIYYMETYGIPAPEDFKQYLKERDYVFPDYEELSRNLQNSPVD